MGETLQVQLHLHRPAAGKRPAGPPRIAASPMWAPRLGASVPVFLEERCMDCGGCVGVCPHDALDLFQGFITVRATCTECDLCTRLCPVEAFLSVKPS